MQVTRYLGMQLCVQARLCYISVLMLLQGLLLLTAGNRLHANITCRYMTLPAITLPDTLLNGGNYLIF